MNALSGCTPASKAWLWVSVPLRKGCTPWSLTLVSTGLITNKVRNRARPASTWLGGVAWSPRALRVRPSTTKILVKLVVSSSRAGATERAVIARITTTELDGLPFEPWVPPPISTFRLGRGGGGGAAGRLASDGPLAAGRASGAAAGTAAVSTVPVAGG